VRRAGILNNRNLSSFDGPRLRLTRRVASSTFWVVAGCAVLFMTATIGVQLAYAERVPSGVQVLGVDIGGRTRAEARAVLQATASSLLRQPITLRANGREWQSTPRDLGMQVDTDELIDQAFGVGREGNPFRRIADQWSTLFRGQRLVATGIDFDEDQQLATLQRIAADIDQPAQDARIDLTPSADVAVRILPEQAGVRLLVSESADRLREALDVQRPAASIELLVETTLPSTVAPDLREARAMAEQALSSPLVLTYQERRWALERADIAKLLSFPRAPGQPAQVVVNTDGLSVLFGKVSKEIDQAPVEARFDWNGGNLRVVRESQEGQTIDADALKAQIRDRLFSTERTIPLALAATPPKVASGDAPKLGIKELIRDGRTTFAGSVSEKQENIKLAASRLNGAVVPPGEIFSFNKEVGPTTLAAGFKTGWGITLSSTGAQTIPSVAGGICQVATTLFHPIFHAGYAIEERHSHLYWIPSYGQAPLGMKGLDATVDEDYGLDFQFVNTTQDYLLIQSRVEGTSLIFGLFGTKPTWDVKIDGPLITNVVPTDRGQVTQPEPSMPAGRRLQVEGAQDGFDTTIIRTVSQGNESRTLTLKSQYIPSHNVVLYGTGTS